MSEELNQKPIVYRKREDKVHRVKPASSREIYKSHKAKERDVKEVRDFLRQNNLLSQAG